ncbi:hypothetical protein V6N11_055520 [Hibiscus sabdariffa]|uniref:Uncharacterized protein n=1 Tax=Hibiscus sabdariffa TaxID=183260 RepID=A0ABR2NQS1_9ROSI
MMVTSLQPITSSPENLFTLDTIVPSQKTQRDLPPATPLAEQVVTKKATTDTKTKHQSLHVNPLPNDVSENQQPTHLRGTIHDNAIPFKHNNNSPS